MRHAAENDFERHRLDVLERDLTTPPTVEIISDTHQRFDGTNYYINKSGHYTSPKSLHRDIWAYYHGEIPQNYVIHHIDHNPNNNNIKNLQLLTLNEHIHIHKANIYPEKICPVCGKTFKSNRNNPIYCSRSCVNIHMTTDNPPKKCIICGKTFIPPKHHKDTQTCSPSCSAKSAWLLKKANAKEYICEVCGNHFLSSATPPPRFCSKKCQMRNARSQESHQEIRKCPVCGDTFLADKYSTKKYCSSRCFSKFISARRSKPKVKHICEYCKKEFFTVPSRAGKYCSVKCYREAKRKK